MKKTENMRRRVIAMMLVLVLGAGAAGCGSKKAETTDAGLTQTTTVLQNALEDESVSETTVSTEAETEEGTEEETTAAEENESEGAETEETPESESESSEETETGAAGEESGTTAENSGNTTSEENEATTAAEYTYTSLDKTMYAKSAVNVRSIPSKNGTKLGSLTAGQEVTVTGQCNENGWYRISYNGSTGYCSSNYLTSTKPTATTTASGSSGNSGSGSNSGNSSSGSGSSSGSSGNSSDSSSDDSEYIEVTLEELYAIYAAYVVEIVNEERAAAGLSALEVDVELMAIAQTRAEELATTFSHTRPDGTSYWTAYSEAGYDYGVSAENIAFGFESPYDVMYAWMNSEGHKANILSDTATTIGVGVYWDGYNMYWTQEFTSPYRSNTPDKCDHDWGTAFTGQEGGSCTNGTIDGKTLVIERYLNETTYYICYNCNATCADLSCDHNWVVYYTGDSEYVGYCSGIEYTVSPDVYIIYCTKCGAFWFE